MRLQQTSRKPLRSRLSLDSQERTFLLRQMDPPQCQFQRRKGGSRHLLHLLEAVLAPRWALQQARTASHPALQAHRHTLLPLSLPLQPPPHLAPVSLLVLLMAPICILILQSRSRWVTFPPERVALPFTPQPPLRLLHRPLLRPCPRRSRRVEHIALL